MEKYSLIQKFSKSNFSDNPIYSISEGKIFREMAVSLIKGMPMDYLKKVFSFKEIDTFDPDHYSFLIEHNPNKGLVSYVEIEKGQSIDDFANHFTIDNLTTFFDNYKGDKVAKKNFRVKLIIEEIDE